MSFHSLFVVSLLALANAQTPATTSLEALASKHFSYDALPYQISGNNAGPRGPQLGYNLCNSTTENQSSLCQTLVMNSLSDFCIWSSPKPNDTIADSEQYEVAYCTQPGHGARLIPPGAITGVQFLYAKNYIQVAGYIDQTKVSLFSGDEGGGESAKFYGLFVPWLTDNIPTTELDPHGDDEQGNPLGGVVYTNGMGSNTAAWVQQFKGGANDTITNLTQVTEWVT